MGLGIVHKNISKKTKIYIDKFDKYGYYLFAE